MRTRYRTRLACIGLLFLLLMGAQAPADEPIPIELPDAGLYADATARNKRCLAADITTETGTLLKLDTEPLVAGAYRVHVRLKLSHTIHPQVACLAFRLATVGAGEKAGRTLTVLDFDGPGQYQTFVLPLLVRKNDTVCGVDLTWEWLNVVKDYKRPLAEMKAPATPSGGGLMGGEEEIELDLDAKDLSEIRYHIACDSVFVERVSDAAIKNVTANKLVYHPGETATITGTALNLSDSARTVTLRPVLVQGLDNERPLPTQTIKLPAFGAQNFTVSAPLTDTLWGHEVRCDLVEGETTLADGRAVFAVHSNPWAVLNAGYGMDHTVYRATMADTMADSAKAKYWNEMEFVFWAPNDFGGLNPEGPYYSGQLRRVNDKAGTIKLIEAYHKRGIACAMYVLIHGNGGRDGYELMRKHPDWFIPDFYDVAQLDRWDRSEEMRSWPLAFVKPDAMGAFAHHAREIAKSATTFGWDIARYDSDMTRMETEPVWENAAKVMHMVKETVWKDHPDFAWGYNTGVHRRDDAPEGLFEELCRGGGCIMDEYNQHAFKDRWSYDKYTNRHILFRDKVQKMHGYMAYWNGIEGLMFAPRTYAKIFALAARAHTAIGSKEEVPAVERTYGAFLHRYAGYLWDLKAAVLPNAKELISWEKDGDKLYKWPQYTYLRPTGENTSELIIQMINAPTEKNINTTRDNRVPPVRTDVPCTIKLPAGVQVRDVWCTTAAPTATQTKLEHTTGANTVRFVVPRLHLWNMLIIRLNGKGEWK